MFETIKNILISEMNIDAELIKPEAELIASLGLNSLELADMIVMCEDRFGIVFEDEDLASLITIGDVVAYLEART
ncbi:MAG: acyl carrier protein [Clostridia bacterium]|nr:acyl carrier protein [Clostridia bacterium]MBQ3155139.1 acyl carrier protein [Clostridia bacterium]